MLHQCMRTVVSAWDSLWECDRRSGMCLSYDTLRIPAYSVV